MIDEQLEFRIAQFADGAIVGSAIVKRMKQNEPRGVHGIVEAISTYCRDLLSEVR